jgi:gamma-polyglutamate biosynthesis protein CapA
VHSQPANRRLALLTLAVWIMAIALAALYLTGVRLGDRAIGISLGDPPAVAPGDPSRGEDGSSGELDEGGAGGDAASDEDLRPEPDEIGGEQSDPATARSPLTIAAGGDVIGDRKVATFIDKHGGEAVFAGVRDLLREADLAFVNLESPLSDKGQRKTAKDVTFRGRPALVAGLASAGIDVVSIANNHTLDWGAEALLDTIERLEQAGIKSAGAGADLAAARRPALLETAAGRVAVLAFSNILPEGFPAGEGRAGVNPARPDRERLLGDVTAAAEEADWVIVSVHWGKEYQPDANADQRELAHQLVDAGADLILGHHPHVIQGLELYRDRLIAYSLGDFVFDHYSRETGEAFVLDVSLQPVGPPAILITPVYLDDSYGIPAVVHGGEADRILDRLGRLSSALGMELQRRGDTLVFGGE